MKRGQRSRPIRYLCWKERGLAWFEGGSPRWKNQDSVRRVETDCAECFESEWRMKAGKRRCAAKECCLEQAGLRRSALETGAARRRIGRHF